MSTPLVLVPICFEWVLLITTVAPIAFVGRPWFYRHPNAGLAIWLSALASAVIVAGVGALLVLWAAFELALETRSAELGSPNWWLAFGLSFLPWLWLGLVGIALALLNLKLQPQLDSTKELNQILTVIGVPLMRFENHQVLRFDHPELAVFTIKVDRSSKIYISSTALDKLSEKQLEAVLTHEYAHIKLRHSLIKKIASLLFLFTPWLAASSAFLSEVQKLSEVAADLSAFKNVASEHLEEARSKFETTF